MTDKPTPDPVHNRPGLHAISRRIGTLREFYASQRMSLSDPHRPGLAGLTTRDPQDPTMALLAAWSEVGDILTFYSERINTESYLGTATERVSLRQIGRLVGYTPEPATAALVWLAFEIDGSLLPTGVHDFAPGIAVQSLPLAPSADAGPPALPQTFETTEPLRGSAAWNAIRPVRARLVTPGRTTRTLRLASDSPRPRRGEAVVVEGADGRLLRLDAAPMGLVAPVRRVEDVETGEHAGDVRVMLSNAPGTPTEILAVAGTASVPTGAITANTLGPALRAARWSRADVRLAQAEHGLSTADLDLAVKNVASATNVTGATLNARALRLSTRARLFGHNTNDSNADPCSILSGELVLGGMTPSGFHHLFLDRAYPELVAGDHVVIRGEDTTRSPARMIEVATRILEATTVSVSGFGMAGESTRLKVEERPFLHLGRIRLRSAVVLSGAEELALVPTPLDAPVGGASLLCEGVHIDLAVGQRVVLMGERADIAGVPATEILKVAEVSLEAGSTRLVFDTPLAHAYLRGTVRLNANVALASHGESREVVLGSGSGATASQRFPLPDAPLTYLPAETATGRRAALSVAVGGTRWEEVANFDLSGPEDRVFRLDTDPAGRLHVAFGDGVRGARLPTGQANVVATYRVGAGEAGRVDAGRITSLLRKPLGVGAVTNPQASFGGSAGETAERMRENIPVNGLTLGRIVSLSDYADFARGFAGIAKAHASWGWQGETRLAWLSVAGEGGQVLPLDTGVLPRLSAQVSRIGPPGAGVIIRNHTPVATQLSARLFVEDGFDADAVLDAARAELLARFGFEARRIGEPLRASRVMAALQSPAGVRAVDIDLLHRADQPPANHAMLRARRIRRGSRDAFQGAELITLSREGIRLGVAR